MPETKEHRKASPEVNSMLREIARTRWSPRIRTVVFARQGTRVVAGSPDDNSILVWNPANGERQLLRGHTDASLMDQDGIETIVPGGVHHLALSSGGDILASASGDRTVRVWHLPSGHTVNCLRPHWQARQVLFSADGKHLAAVEYDERFTRWDLSSGQRDGGDTN